MNTKRHTFGINTTQTLFPQTSLQYCIWNCQQLYLVIAEYRRWWAKLLLWSLRPSGSSYAGTWRQRGQQPTPGHDISLCRSGEMKKSQWSDKKNTQNEENPQVPPSVNQQWTTMEQASGTEKKSKIQKKNPGTTIHGWSRLPGQTKNVNVLSANYNKKPRVWMSKSDPL